MKNILLSSVLVLLCFFSCGPKQPEIPPCKEFAEAPQEFLDYWFFPKGSFWVYKLDSSADIYDTVVVDISNAGRGVTDPEAGIYEGCGMVYWTSLTHSDTIFHTPPKKDIAFRSKSNFRTYYGKTTGSWSLYDEGGDGKYLMAGDLFWYPFKDGEIAEGNSTDIKFNGLITFESSKFGVLDSTIFLSTTIKFYNSRHFKEMYIAKNIGIVKIKYNSGEVWELVGYKIKE